MTVQPIHTGLTLKQGRLIPSAGRELEAGRESQPGE